MPEWNLEPERLACMVMQLYPREPEEIVIDFLGGAAAARDHSKALFWTMVLNLVEQMHREQIGEPVVASETHCGTVM